MNQWAIQKAQMLRDVMINVLRSVMEQTACTQGELQQALHGIDADVFPTEPHDF